MQKAIKKLLKYIPYIMLKYYFRPIFGTFISMFPFPNYFTIKQNNLT